VHSTHASIAIKICHFYVNPFNTCDAIAIDGERCASQKFYDANRGNHKSVISVLAHELNFARSVFCTFVIRCKIVLHPKLEHNLAIGIDILSVSHTSHKVRFIICS
jgi:hypothetical protein